MDAEQQFDGYVKEYGEDGRILVCLMRGTACGLGSTLTPSRSICGKRDC
jgi:hypothetical protein